MVTGRQRNSSLLLGVLEKASARQDKEVLVMKRRHDIERFYVLLGKLKDKIGFRRLANCSRSDGMA